MHRPHGGKLVNRTLDEKRAGELKGMDGKLPEIILSHEKVQDVFNIAYGVYSPLEGFMSEEDYKSVIIRSRLASDLAWTIPVVLDVDSKTGKKFKHGDSVLLKEESGQVVACLTVWDAYSYDKTEYVKSVFG
ncbi:MAG: sulfate adenylyltransferase, partial [Candidatus Omnitrophota bacterium]